MMSYRVVCFVCYFFFTKLGLIFSNFDILSFVFTTHDSTIFILLKIFYIRKFKVSKNIKNNIAFEFNKMEH